MKYYLAVDIGTTGGRHVIGWRENGKIKTEEIYRFPNAPVEVNGHSVWNVKTLLFHVKTGIKKAKDCFNGIVSLSIDAWGVDYVLLRGEQEVTPCYSYLDRRTEALIPEVHQQFSFPRLYHHTGIQFQPGNTVYQLYADKQAGRLAGVTDFLMMPEYLMYKLCGVKSHEYTIATTGGMVSAETGEYDPTIIGVLGLPEHLFCPLQSPGTVIGEIQGIEVVLCASHNAASTVEGIDMAGNQPYISSGAWGVLGIKTPKPITIDAGELSSWTNEGGPGYNRYQKNLMGMWIIDRLREELAPDITLGETAIEAEESHYSETVDLSSPVFLRSDQVHAAFDQLLRMPPRTAGDYFRCAYRSLALSYRDALEDLERSTRIKSERVYIVGDGAKNMFLNRLTEQATGKKVIARPADPTAIGNLKLQMATEQ